MARQTKSMITATTPSRSRPTLRRAAALSALALAAATGTALTAGSAAAVPSGPKPNVTQPASATNGWGPWELDRSNGDRRAGDGRTISVGGQKYEYGLGVHSTSDIRYDLNGYCQGVSGTVGVDDEVGNRGSVRFWIRVDGRTVFKTGVMTGSDGPRDFFVGTDGGQDLQLLVTDAGDGKAYDHADWADLSLVCD